MREKLAESELSKLPSGYQIIGHIIILNLHPEIINRKKIIAREILNFISHAKTICIKKGSVHDQYRKPSIEYVLGKKDFEVTLIENKCKYKFDARKIMFSKGNKYEKLRIVKLVKPNEIIVDMFSGVGYWSIPIAKFSNPKKVYSIEINPTAYHYLCENIKLNNVRDKVIPIHGDCVVEIPKLGRVADRVIMGLLPSSKEYLLDAMKVVKTNGIIHYHAISKKDNWKELLEDVKTAAEIEGFKVKLKRKVRVKSYAPKIYHFVLDCEIFS